MNVRYYAIKDILVNDFMNLRPMQNDEVAKRALSIAANDPEAFKDNKKDIQLWYVMTVDSTTGLVVDNNPQLIGNLASFIVSEVPNSEVN